MFLLGSIVVQHQEDVIRERYKNTNLEVLLNHKRLNINCHNNSSVGRGLLIKNSLKCPLSPGRQARDLRGRETRDPRSLRHPGRGWGREADYKGDADAAAVTVHGRLIC